MYEHDETMAYPPEMEDTKPAEEAEGAQSDCKAEEICEADAADGNGRSTQSESRIRSKAEEQRADPADPEDFTKSSDPASQALESNQTADSELEYIRRELSMLRSQLDGQTRAMQKIGLEYAEFCDLYPEKSPEDLPDEVWENVQRGVPLSAAYALAERRRIRTAEKARSLNEENKKRSAGSVETEQTGFFSANEVRAMSQAEVRANYQNILRSMPKWR